MIYCHVVVLYHFIIVSCLLIAELLAMYQIGDVVPFLQNIPSRL